VSEDFLFASGSVTEGHPDKLCDQISDAIVDRFLLQDPLSRVAAECAVSKGLVFVACHFASGVVVDIPELARQMIGQVGYDEPRFNVRDCTVMTTLTELPSAPWGTIDERELDDDGIERIGATHVANAFGFACNQTAALMPMPIWLAHKLARRLTAVRLQRLLRYLAPDGKAQVAVEYHDRRPRRIHSITLVATRKAGEQPPPARMRDDLFELVLRPALADEAVGIDDGTLFFVNPEGPGLDGGPAAHSGLTGRKNADDTYGEYAHHSEAALSGKDPTRIDRVGAYAARHAAKNVVAAGLADECEVQLCYTIGRSRPVSLRVRTFGTGRMPDGEIAARLQHGFDFRPAAIVRRFRLRELPALHRGRFYARLAAYGHMGRMDLALPWEVTDRTAELR
jgi:S-adenosylmethionine synthetase